MGDTVRQRANLYAQIRNFFSQRNVLEVETPIFSAGGNTDPHIHSLTADFSPVNSSMKMLYAQTSPEFAMKRLLLMNYDSIYQICKVFRVGELGRRHNPEFTMLEWYRSGFSYHQLMDEVEDLFSAIGISQKCERISYRDLFFQNLNIDILNASVSDLKQLATHHQISVIGMDDHHNDWCDVLMTHLIEPSLGMNAPIFVFDYPSAQAALAEIRADNPPVAERFEVYVKGVEIGNGYQELTDGKEYAIRFRQENEARRFRGLETIDIDETFLADLEAGLPYSAGIAIGLDRLLMCLQNTTDITNVLPFSDIR